MRESTGDTASDFGESATYRVPFLALLVEFGSDFRPPMFVLFKERRRLSLAGIKHLGASLLEFWSLQNKDILSRARRFPATVLPSQLENQTERYGAMF